MQLTLNSRPSVLFRQSINEHRCELFSAVKLVNLSVQRYEASNI